MADVLRDKAPGAAVAHQAATAGAGSVLSSAPTSRAPAVASANPAAGVAQALPSLFVRIVLEPQSAMRTFVTDAQVSVVDTAGRVITPVRQGGNVIVELPRAVGLYRIHVSSAGGQVFPQDLKVDVTPDRVLLDRVTPEVGPLVPVGAGGTTTFRLPVVLPRVRDVTGEAQTLLGRTWQPPTRAVHVLTDPPPGKLDFTSTTVTPARTEVFELAHLDVPKWVSVSWPAGMTAGSPFRFLLYLHHRLLQNKKVYAGKPYPRDNAYMEFGLHHYLDYAGAPLSGLNAGKGLAFQLAAAGRGVALVLPLPRFEEVAAKDTSIGKLANGSTLEVVLQEIAAHAARRMPGAPIPPAIDRLAVASFSSGAEDTETFLRNASTSSFLRRTLREAYRFEGINDQRWLDAAVAWAASVPTGEPRPRIRIYRQFDATHIKAYLPHGFKLWPAPGDRTYAALPAAAWQAAGATADLKIWHEVEALIANMMLVDALRRSGF
ncbi:hypothetical protein ACTMTJ_20520 [Phytohabitans sp. LJ34]|uniref:hypothetical protein n=1 Tax=Phytohabitans sp. LJ34 TaxID=3452217 RepID=UPI003F88A805